MPELLSLHPKALNPVRPVRDGKAAESTRTVVTLRLLEVYMAFQDVFQQAKISRRGADAGIPPRFFVSTLTQLQGRPKPFRG